MIAGVELQDDGAEAAIEAQIKSVLQGVDGATVDIEAGGARGGALNALIARVQKTFRRNPFYLDEQAKEAIRFALRGATAAQFSTRLRSLLLVGDLMKSAVLRNVDEQQNPDGSAFKELTAAYAAAKRRKHGFIVPILKATGDLLGGLKVRVTMAK
jgi:hypothetical protein